ncbi:MAG: TRAP transporter small permease [Elusimicrobia bacterium]|nr:TRAP transporter small permease [Elusimicrobiota bacterium]
MNRIKGLESRLIRAESALLAALVAFMVLLAFLQVVLRAFFSAGILWADTLLRHLVLWLGFLGAGLAAGSDRQFALDIAARLSAGRLKASLQLGCALFAAGVSTALARSSLTFFREEYRHAGALFAAGDLNVPAWPFQIILPGGFALLAIHYALKAALAAHDLLKPPPGPPGPALQGRRPL